MTTAEEQVKLLAIGLAAGCTTRDVCPKCGGGTSGEKTFSVTRTRAGQLGFYCHRASCGYRGMVGASAVGTEAVAPQAESRWYTGPSRNPTQQELTWFGDKFGFPLDERVDVATNRVMFRLLTVDGRTWGYVGRSYSGAVPKALTYWRDGDKPDQLAWQRPSYYRDVGHVVLAEDIVSAKKISRLGYDAAALLGTHLGPRKLLELVNLGRPVILALDPDRAGLIATAKAVRELFTVLPVTVARLEADPKDMTFDKLGEALVRAKVTERSSVEPAGVPQGGEVT
jgi:hypothetical protein